jgi:3'-phosphoadenosine 5'-phosphosulfate sulfotransferase (PAPS reductase)/FAD synthetase
VIHIVSVSGGKDSTALWLWALRTDLSPLVPLFCDTHWEAQETYDYLDLLEQRLGPIRRLSSEGFEARTRRGGTFPSRARKWCSPELKVEMCAAELLKIRDETGDDVEVLLGIRREESPKRADEVLTPEREWSDAYDCEVWRPILGWTVQQVIAEHHAANVPLNPLYLLGADRVGCWPCIHAGKTELRLIADHDPARLDRVAALEAEIGQTMFVLEKPRSGGTEREKIPTPIHQMAVWARTSRGGKELSMWGDASGCFRWGTCERPDADPA